MQKYFIRYKLFSLIQSLTLLSFLIFGCTLLNGCKKNQQDPTATLTFNSNSYVCEIGNSGCINVAVSSIPTGGSISYTIDKPAIASVNKTTGKISPIAAGTAIVTATQAAIPGVNQQANASYTLSISLPTPVLKFAISNNLSCYTGSTSCSNVATSSIPTGGAITYAIDKPNVATINSLTGAINSLSAGTATVTATQAMMANVNLAASATYILTISDPIPVLQFSSPNSYLCELGSTSASNVVSSSIPSGGAISYSIDKTSIATVNATNGKITPVSIGTAVVTATQTAKPGINQQVSVSYNLTVNSPTITLSPSTTQTLNYPANSYVIQVTTSVSWTAVSNNTSWCNISGGSGTGNGSFVVSCLAYNAVGNSRSAIVSVTGPGGTPSSSINFSQFGYPPNPSLTISNGVNSGNNLSMGVNKLTASLFTITVTSNVAWVASSGSSSWCGANASGFGNGSFQLSTTANTAGSPRTATVTIIGSGGSPSATITVSQN